MCFGRARTPAAPDSSLPVRREEICWLGGSGKSVWPLRAGREGLLSRTKSAALQDAVADVADQSGGSCHSRSRSSVAGSAF